ncbi:hypothetical protein D3C86_2113710 [compost metagenome]
MDNIFAVGSDQKVRTGLSADKILILVNQVLQGFGIAVTHGFHIVFVGTEL